jgi:ubiquinone/menaquinone biosynthesis C-methylase UbiE
MEVLRREDNNPAAWALQAELYAVKGKISDAISSCARAICANPAALEYKQRFIELASGRTVTRYDELNEYALTECLKTPESLDCQRINLLWSTHITCTPDFYATYGQALVTMKLFDPANKEFFEKITNFKPLFSPCFLMGLRDIVVHTPLFEEFLTHIRKHLLQDHGLWKKFTREEAVTLASALAQYIFNTDYILDCSKEELDKVQSILLPDDAAAVALFACYTPLSALPNKEQLSEAFSSSPEMSSLIKTQITDVEALRTTAQSVIAITPIDELSSKVQEQYEEFPYPRWKSFSREYLQRGWERSARNVQVEGPLRGKKIKILIAGCGTGQQALTYAAIFPDADILAVDLSRTSLAYAINKAEEFNIKNITFRQADILRLGELDCKFNYVISVGVIHHMKDPVAAAKILSGLLKRDGLMRLGLYSRMGRAAVVEAQRVIKKNACSSDTASMKNFRRKSPTLLEQSTLDDVIRFGDYYNLNTYRDLLFHVQEHTYDISGIEEMLAAAELEFISFFLPSSVLNEYAKQYPDDPQQTSLANWHQFEEKRPATFRGMYIFWCRKSG